jgi:hypothetical protein
VAGGQVEHVKTAHPVVAMPDLRRPEPIETDGPNGVETQRVTAVVSLAVIRESSIRTDEPSEPRGVEVDLILAIIRRPVAVLVGVGFGLWAVAAIAVGDTRVGLGSALVVVLAGSVRYVDRHVAFSFGEGFVGYRGDPAWPQGVQEEVDVRWDWRAAERQD